MAFRVCSCGVGAHGHLSHIDVAVGHGDLSQASSWMALPAAANWSHLADVGGLGSLAAGVGVHLGVEDQDVHILAGGQDVVHAAEADVVGPAVAAEDPHGLLGQVFFSSRMAFGQLAGVAVAVLLPLAFSSAAVVGELVTAASSLSYGSQVVLQSAGP